MYSFDVKYTPLISYLSVSAHRKQSGKEPNSDAASYIAPITPSRHIHTASIVERCRTVKPSRNSPVAVVVDDAVQYPLDGTVDGNTRIDAPLDPSPLTIP